MTEENLTQIEPRYAGIQHTGEQLTSRVTTVTGHDTLGGKTRPNKKETSRRAEHELGHAKIKGLFGSEPQLSTPQVRRVKVALKKEVTLVTIRHEQNGNNSE
jgi:hypothetical protein